MPHSPVVLLVAADQDWVAMSFLALRLLAEVLDVL